MAMDFPTAPTDGQIYSPAGGPDYIYRAASGAWEIKTSGSNSAFVAKAGDVMTGDLTIEKTNARLFLNAAVASSGLVVGQRGTSQRWAIYAPTNEAESGGNVGSNFQIQRFNDAGADLGNALRINRATGHVSLQVDPVSALHAVTKQYSDARDRRRNRIINGAMQLAQEYGDALLNPTATANYYIADQWRVFSSTSPGLITMQRTQNAITPGGAKDRIRVSVTTAKAALATSDHLMFEQPIEGNYINDFQYGLASAKQAVLRFGFRAPAGTYSICVLNAAADRAYVANFTITAGQANTDTEQVFAIPGDTTGAWLKDAGIGMYLRVILASGTSWHGVAGWQAGAKFGTAANSNGIATVGNVFELFDVGLYLDPDNTGVAPKWELPDGAQELLACQRYFELVVGHCRFYNGSAVGEFEETPIYFKAPKRAEPTWVSWTAGIRQNVLTIQVYSGGVTSGRFLIGSTGTVGDTYALNDIWAAFARLT